MSNVLQWKHQGIRYGDDASYLKAAAWLDDGEVEDWGGGPGYAKQFFHHGYKLVDGTRHDGVDVVTNLAIYRSNTHGILLRHVIEHSMDWKLILGNAIASCQKLALVIFTPFGDETRVIATNPNGSPDISFSWNELTGMLGSYSSESIKSDTQYGGETIFYVQGRL